MFRVACHMYSSVLNCTRLFSSLLLSSPLLSTPLHSTPFLSSHLLSSPLLSSPLISSHLHSTPRRAATRRTKPLYSTAFHSVLLHTTLPYSTTISQCNRIINADLTPIPVYRFYTGLYRRCLHCAYYGVLRHAAGTPAPIALRHDHGQRPARLGGAVADHATEHGEHALLDVPEVRLGADGGSSSRENPHTGVCGTPGCGS